jgi:TPP-dependent pyruvate/acetoin dehydrogenase alpha subunit
VPSKIQQLETTVTKKLEREDLLKAYRTMRTIREFEERLHTDFATGEIPASCTCMPARRPRPPACA